VTDPRVPNTPSVPDAPARLTHLDSDGRARMVDVADKAVTTRTAVATGRIVLLPHVVVLVRADDLPKADVLATARIAGIAGAKKTSELIPLCHQIPLSSVKIDFAFETDGITITATAKTTGQTGVEMEALTAVAIAGLTLHDMVKTRPAASAGTGPAPTARTLEQRPSQAPQRRLPGTPRYTRNSRAPAQLPLLSPPRAARRALATTPRGPPSPAG
jgi:cyclic pyranopterin phosphate synthase